MYTMSFSLTFTNSSLPKHMSCLSGLMAKGTVICVDTALHQGRMGDRDYRWTLTLNYVETNIEAGKEAYHVDVTPMSVQRVLQQPVLVTKAVEEMKRDCR